MRSAEDFEWEALRYLRKDSRKVWAGSLEILLQGQFLCVLVGNYLSEQSSLSRKS